MALIMGNGTLQQAPQPVFTASPTTIEPGPARSPARPPLPGRSINSASIEDAYVAFILYCNPAVPLDTDTATLRDAFRTPPKSGGKSFSTFTLFELIKKLETKELKTWAELALKLGVEPPDQEKGQSSQKIQQYAVRLKRWMHSMHVDAFFEYLMDREHPYWTEIPLETTPITETGRDGVAAEDDMALRALLPQIKPRRGRRKPEDEDIGKSPSQRPSPSQDEYPASARPDINEPWTAHPEGRGSVFLFPPVPDATRLSASIQQSHWGSNDVSQTPLSAYPQSAITPMTRNAFWADEPRSALSPPKARSASRRHGAKVVSSAWRSGGASSTGKTRGRPPINRASNIDGPFSAFPAISEVPTFKVPSPTPERQTPPNTRTPPQSLPAPQPFPTSIPALPRPAPTPAPAPPPAQTINQSSPIQETPPARPVKRSRLSLQVPERVGGEVRLATPPLPLTAPPTAPPVVMINGQAAPVSQGSISSNSNTPTVQQGSQSQTQPMPSNPPAAPAHADGVEGLFNHWQNSGGPSNMSPNPAVAFQDPTDRTNFDAVEDVFIEEVLLADWLNSKGERIPGPGYDEAWGLSQTVVENLRRSAPTKEAFLINLSALVGGKIMMPKGTLRITRLESPIPDQNRYLCTWELRYGDIRGSYSMEETVAHEKWMSRSRTEGETPNKDETEKWKRMYKEVTEAMRQKDEEMLRLRRKVADCMRQT